MKDPTGTPSTLQDIKHTWDATGNLTQRENVVDVEKETFGYDFLDRLISANNYLFTFGNTGGSPNTVNQPWKATVDSSGNILVADTYNNRIAKYNSSGVYQSSFGSAGSGDGQFQYPGGVTVDSSGNIYVSDYYNHRIQKFDSAGNFITKWGSYGTGDGQFKYPTDIVYNSSSGYLYITEQFNQRVQYFSTSGTFQGKWGSSGTGDGQFRYAQGIGVDSSGYIYVADTANNRIQKFSSTGTFSAKWGSYGTGDGQFNQPHDVAVDGSGNMYIADRDNHRIQKLSSSGTFIVKWGTSGSGEGQFSSPRGVALSSERIYVVDTGNSRLVAYDLSTTAGWSYNQLGNITYNDGAAYTYGSKPHAATQAGSTSYAYDSDGNMTTRGNQSLTWDVENRMTAITNVATFVYDGNGFRVKKTESSNTILYVNKYYEKNTTTGTVTLYYYIGEKLIAYKEVPSEGQSTLRYINQDHLTGTSLTTDTSGNSTGTIKYKPYGETDASSGTLPAQKFTGQRLDNTGLYYYGARYYDPGLARFVSPDTIVPNYANPQSLNRYSYVVNNPLKYIDPTGHSYTWDAGGPGLDMSQGGVDDPCPIIPSSNSNIQPRNPGQPESPVQVEPLVIPQQSTSSLQSIVNSQGESGSKPTDSVNKDSSVQLAPFSKEEAGNVIIGTLEVAVGTCFTLVGGLLTIALIVPSIALAEIPAVISTAMTCGGIILVNDGLARLTKGRLNFLPPNFPFN